MKINRWVLLLMIVFITSCKTSPPILISEHNEALSKSVYATSDALSVSRVDLAITFANESTRLVNPPKERVSIKPIPNKKGQRTIILPEEFKDKQVILVNSEEYNNILKEQEIAKQIKEENQAIIEQIKITDKELRRQTELKIYLAKEVNQLRETVSEKEGQISARNDLILYLSLALGSVIILIIAYITLKIKGLLPSFLLF